jgi:hypothetical protein
MRNADIIAELHAALRRQGIWGQPANRLIEEWRSHIVEDTARRVDEGASITAAEEAAWRALGNPQVLAAKASRELTQASWLGRHPWMGGLALPALGWLAILAVLLLAPVLIVSHVWDLDSLERVYPAPLPAALVHAVVLWQVAFNWLPWLCALAWICHLAVKMPGGWKLFWITATALTPLSTWMQAVVTPPIHGLHSGTLMFFPNGILGALTYAILHLTTIAEVGPWSLWLRQSTHYPSGSIQQAVMAAGLIVFHWKMRKSPAAARAT